jgi:hypothetical protein
MIRSALAAILLWGANLTLAPAMAGQARPPLSLAADSSGVLSAIRGIDYLQLCRCPTLLLDSVVRRGPRARVYEVVHEPPAFILDAAAVGRLRLARHRVVRTALRAITRKGRDTLFMAVQLIQPGPGRRVLVVATPPNGITIAYLVSLERHRASWRIRDVRTVYDP